MIRTAVIHHLNERFSTSSRAALVSLVAEPFDIPADAPERAAQPLKLILRARVAARAEGQKENVFIGGGRERA